MSRKEGKDYLYLIWKEPVTRRNYVVGELCKNGQYEFSYGYEVQKAIENGFELLISFEDINKTYKSDTLFPTFSSRLPDRKRRGIERILSKYGLDAFDDYTLLKKSGARLPIDTLEFIDPILNTKDGEVERVFHIAGIRHYIGCGGDDCEEALRLIKGDQLTLKPEPSNMHDKNAIKILDKKDNHVGYLPRYYCESVLEYLKKDSRYTCTVLEVDKDMQCNECVKVKLELQCEIKRLNKIS
ncbi:MAG: DNA-binding protein [Firmicutes bacterium HGW-Firmicutes-3]|nr:MAG: DNA-binding protein [Firmicutes bacterium HGW-Firmicutes-3]